MANKSKGARFGLGEPWQGQLADFCAAHYGASERDVIRAALDVFITKSLADEPTMAERYEIARKRRIGITGDVVRIVKE